MINRDTAYVFNGTEVVLTGKVAKKTLRSGKESTLYEIRPRTRENGTWTKWVHLTDLFEIVAEPAPPAPLQVVKKGET
jgi:hypothetical protein